ncbi:MAG TPA: hypothetical protein VF997_21335, partial [Polyangia bacterium]
MSLRACLVVAVAVAIAACKGPAGRDAADLSVASAPRGCPAFPSGSVLVVGQRYQANGAASSRTGMVAGFHRATDLPCTDSTMGTCVAIVSGPRDADAGLGPASFGAGTISVTGGAMSIQQAPLPSASGTSYPMFQAMQAPWNGGETITVAAAGGDVPAFSTMLTAPAVLTVTAPAW